MTSDDIVASRMLPVSREDVRTVALADASPAADLPAAAIKRYRDTRDQWERATVSKNAALGDQVKCLLNVNEQRGLCVFVVFQIGGSDA